MRKKTKQNFMTEKEKTVLFLFQNVYIPVRAIWWTRAADRENIVRKEATNKLPELERNESGFSIKPRYKEFSRQNSEVQESQDGELKRESRDWMVFVYATTTLIV